jgi:hypothetical protein
MPGKLHGVDACVFDAVHSMAEVGEFKPHSSVAA